MADDPCPGGVSPAEFALCNGFVREGATHFGRPLRDHLLGCHRLLIRWGAPLETCLAGLFHSVYGTSTYRHVSVDVSERSRVREAIGDAAERLVYLFCFGDRRRLLLENVMPPHLWRHRAGGGCVELDTATFRSLCVLELANFVEQLPYIDEVSDAVIDDMEARLAAQDAFYSPVMRSELGGALARRRGLQGRGL